VRPQVASVGKEYGKACWPKGQIPGKMFIVLVLCDVIGPTYSSLRPPMATFFHLQGCTLWEPNERHNHVLVLGTHLRTLGLFRGNAMKANLIAKSTIALLLCLAASMFLLSPAVKAQAPQSDATVASGDVGPSADDAHDPPSRVARISFTDGAVSLQPGGTGDWGAATKNRPMTIGDKLWVDQNSRAELQAGQAALHLGSMTAISFLNLDQNITQIRLAEGKLNLRVREILQGDNCEVDAPNLAFTVREAGDFRIDVNEDGDYTSVTVIRGQGEIAAGGQTYPVHAGERADVTGTDNDMKFSTAAASAPDDLDRWAQDRDLKEDNSPSAKYVSRDTVGYSDLDENGTWSEQPDYGPVWTPNNVGPDWAPYSYGYWNWVGPWGWTWVGDEPWGFAPYHYGRWNRFGWGWGWCPGPIYGGAFYGPAFVGFLGGFGFGWGHAWFPLGWGEPYRPWYHAGGHYWHNVNVHNTFIRNTNVISGRGNANFNYRYAHNANAVTAASHRAFVNGQAINRGATHLSASALSGASVTNRINASPTRASYLGASNSHGRVATPSASVQNRSVMARTAPAAAASHLPARTMNNSALRPGNSTMASTARPAGTSSGLSANRPSQLSANRPPSVASQGSKASASVNSSARPNTSSRAWSAQGNATDSGRAPQGFGSTNRPANSAAAPRTNSNNRPPWAGSGGAPNSASRNSANRPPSGATNGNRSYTPQSSNGNRGYSAPRSYNPPASRSYSPPHYNAAPRSYSAPHGSSAPHSYSAPHSSGGGSSHSSGGGSHGGGGGSHGGGSHR